MAKDSFSSDRSREFKVIQSMSYAFFLESINYIFFRHFAMNVCRMEFGHRICWTPSLSMYISPVAKFIVPNWGDKVDSCCKGLSYRPARLHKLAGQYDNLNPESTLSPWSGTMNVATGLHL